MSRAETVSMVRDCPVCQAAVLGTMRVTNPVGEPEVKFVRDPVCPACGYHMPEDPYVDQAMDRLVGR